MKPEDLLKWTQVATSIVSLGVPIAQLVVALKAMLTDDQVKDVLLSVRRGWVTAQQENDARITELEAQVAAGG
jgi:hypothetical protein